MRPYSNGKRYLQHESLFPLSQTIPKSQFQNKRSGLKWEVGVDITNEKMFEILEGGDAPGIVG
jgi:hypothetical protein